MKNERLFYSILLILHLLLPLPVAADEDVYVDFTPIFENSYDTTDYSDSDVVDSPDTVSEDVEEVIEEEIVEEESINYSKLTFYVVVIGVCVLIFDKFKVVF